MQIETVGKYQLHMTAQELPGTKGWDPFVSIFKFDEASQDFTCVLAKHHVEGNGYATYEDAIDAATKAGNALLRDRDL
jgi:hypothetical protein